MPIPQAGIPAAKAAPEAELTLTHLFHSIYQIQAAVLRILRRIYPYLQLILLHYL